MPFVWGIAPNDHNTLNVLRIPIVFVPGVMGSRLHCADEDVSWDPDRKYHMWRKWHRVSTDAKLVYLSGDWEVIDEGKKRGWKTVAGSFYKRFLEYLDEEKRFATARCPVYAIGYDWRKSNWVSGAYLKERIEGVLRQETAEELIIITHSMGGLVTRAAIKRYPALASKVRGVIHVVQPAAGAPAAYRRFFTGMQPRWDGNKYLCSILGNRASDFALLISVCQGPMELLPTQALRDTNGDPWVYVRKGEGKSARFNPDTDFWWEPGSLLYDSQESPPGVFNPRLHRKETQASLHTLIAGANSFHQWLELHTHRNTWSIYSAGRETDMATRFDETGSATPQRRDEGDGTVPSPSGAALFPDQLGVEPEDVYLKDSSKRQFLAPGAEHAEVFNNRRVRKAIVTLIEQILKGPRRTGAEP